MKRKFWRFPKPKGWILLGIVLLCSLFYHSKSLDNAAKDFSLKSYPIVLGSLFYRHSLTWGGYSVSQQATSWIGIPDPDWGATIGNPIEYAKPNWPAGWYTDTEEPGYFYIDPSHPNAGAYTYGTPDHPRATDLGGTTWGAGTYIEYGGGTLLGAQKIWTMNGTADNPVWIVGSGGVHNYEFILKGSYIFIDGLGVTKQSKGFELRTHSTSNLHHVCIRNCTMVGEQISLDGAAAISIQGNSTNYFENIVIYNNDISYFGDWQQSTPADYHGVKPRSYTKWVWIVNNHIHHVGGDSVQVGEAQLPLAEYSYYTYVAGNHNHDNYEDGIDIKGTYDVIVSQNNMHGFPTGACGLTHDSPENIWFLFNEMHDAIDGIGLAAATNTWAIGNIIYSINHNTGGWTGSSVYEDGEGIALGDSTGGAIGNIIYNCDHGVQVRASTWIVNNNIISDIAEANGTHIIIADSAVASNTTFDYNLLDGTGQIRWATAPITLVQLQSTYNKGLTSLTGDPAYTNPTTDFTPGSGSDCIDNGSEDTCYSTFYSTYGISIAVDYDGIARSGTWDVGPYEVA